MGLSGCMSCLKYLLFAFNFLFWVSLLKPILVIVECNIPTPMGIESMFRLATPFRDQYEIGV